MRRYAPRALRQWTADIFQGCGVPEKHAVEAAAMLVRSEARDYKSHGMTRVASYVERLQAGDRFLLDGRALEFRQLISPVRHGTS